MGSRQVRDCYIDTLFNIFWSSLICQIGLRKNLNRACISCNEVLMRISCYAICICFSGFIIRERIVKHLRFIGMGNKLTIDIVVSRNKIILDLFNGIFILHCVIAGADNFITQIRFCNRSIRKLCTDMEYCVLCKSLCIGADGHTLELFCRIIPIGKHQIGAIIV